MCLAIPGKVTSLYRENGLAMGKVEFDGTIVDICLAYVPDISIGQYVIVHTGFALNIVDEAEAARTFDLLDQINKTGERA